MGTVAVSEVVWRVRQLIHDSAGSRWDDTEMMRWFNDGIAELMTAKPTANSKRVTIALQAGTIQALPANALQLLRITHNSSGASIRIVDQDRLDAVEPTWRTKTPTAAVQHYIYDPEIPREFEVYPPNTGGGSVAAVVSQEPSRITSMAQLMPVEDVYIPVMVDYLLYRAYSKHSKFAGNEQRARNAYTQFAQALGIKFQAEAGLDPNITNKNPQTGVE